MVFKTKPTKDGWWVEYRLCGYKDGRPIFKEEAVFPDGHRERFRVYGGAIFGYLNTRLGLVGHEPPEDILEVLKELPKGSWIECGT